MQSLICKWVFGSHLSRSHLLVAARVVILYPTHIRHPSQPGERSRSDRDSPADADLSLEAYPHSRSPQFLTRDTGFLSAVCPIEMSSVLAEWEFQAIWPVRGRV